MTKIKNFRNVVTIPRSPFKMTYNKSILLMGSCFSNQMYQYFVNNCFSTLSPFGTIYNPISIADNIIKCLNAEDFTENDIIQYKEVFFSWYHSGKYYAESENLLINEINNEAKLVSKYLLSNPVIMTTFGSSIVYSLDSKDSIVANCHKQPASLFIYRKLAVSEIVEKWTAIINRLDADFVFTVSPVRHYKNGLVENNRSKAALFLAIEQLCKLFPKKVSYFPSYEIMIDELRDYRFYGKDWVHPSAEAVEYIWDKLSSSIFSASEFKLIDKISNIRKQLAHRPNYGITKEHLEFLQKIKKDIIDIKSLTPHYDWSEEIALINQQLEK